MLLLIIKNNMIIMSKGPDKDQRIMEEKKLSGGLILSIFGTKPPTQKPFSIQQEVIRQKKWTRKIKKNRSKVQCKIGQDFYVF